ncbi:ninjurin-1-like [Amblyomma americanum]
MVAANFDMSEGDHEESGRNWYGFKKTVSEGLVDVALLSADAAQLKRVLDLGPEYCYYKSVMNMVAASIGLQVIQLLLLMVVGWLDVSKKERRSCAHCLTNFITLIGAAIVIVNIVAAPFNESVSKKCSSEAKNITDTY